VSEAELTQARECYRRRAWSEAYRLLLLADRKTPLGVEDLERLATSAYLIGRDLDFERFLDRAHHAYVQEGDQPCAARCAFWLGLTLLLRGETGQVLRFVKIGLRVLSNFLQRRSKSYLLGTKSLSFGQSLLTTLDQYWRSVL